MDLTMFLILMHLCKTETNEIIQLIMFISERFTMAIHVRYPFQVFPESWINEGMVLDILSNMHTIVF